VSRIAAGFNHCLALREDGTVVTWGWNDRGQVDVPAGLVDVRDVAAGVAYSLALRSNGTVVGWGLNGYGQATPPDWLHDAIGIAAGGYHGLALLGDGRVVGWGRNDRGQASPPWWLTDVVAIAAGTMHSLALLRDGTVVQWGLLSSSPPEGLRAVAIAAGSYHSLALRSDGTVVGWGANDYGQSTPPPGLKDVVMIAAGDGFSLAVVRIRPRLDAPHFREDGGFEVTVRGEDGVPYTVEYSADLQTWQELTQVVCTNGAATVRDGGAAGLSRRFYRVVAPWEWRPGGVPGL
jgi:alpha-tubulin suppressor-like RCC1 family protein